MRRIAVPAVGIALLGLVWAGPASTQEAAERPVHDEQGAAMSGLQEQALAAMEALREEIATLTALRNAQASLLSWNRGTPWNSGTLPHLENMNTGAPQRTLSAALCNDPAIGAWCPLLPATFGTGKRPGTGELPGHPATENEHDGD